MMLGKFVMIDNPKECSYSTGKIIEVVNDECFLVRLDNMQNPHRRMPLELFSAMDMAETDEAGLKTWRFFESNEERQEYIDWLDSPALPKVVNLVKK